MTDILRLKYDQWKAITQGGSLSTAHKVSHRANRNQVWSGNSHKVLTAVVDEDDYPDWDSNFSGDSILVVTEDEAVAKLVEAAAGGSFSASNDVTVVFSGDAPPLSVESSISDEDRGCGSIPGDTVRYEKVGNVRLPKSSLSAATVYEIAEESILYGVLMSLDSDNIYIQIEIDGQDIFPGTNGFIFEELEDLMLGGTGGGYSSGYGAAGGGEFGFYQYSANKWIWRPPCPLHVVSSLKIKMKSSNSSSSRDALKTIAIRRSLA